jgi:hypothetical protein
MKLKKPAAPDPYQISNPLAVFFASVLPREAGGALKELPVQGWILFLSQQSALFSKLSRWSELYMPTFDGFNIKSDVDRLLGLGISREMIAVTMWAIRHSPRFDGEFGKLGGKRARHRRAKMLLRPIPVLQELAAIFGEIPEGISLQDVPAPRKVISDLEALSSVFTWGEWLYGFLGANSLFEVSRFALASLVHEVAGKFLDREVSSLTGAALREGDYDENRHRVWRIDNYNRLEQNVPFATRLMVAANAVASQSKTAL